jgi:hypothetical protein
MWGRVFRDSCLCPSGRREFQIPAPSLTFTSRAGVWGVEFDAKPCLCISFFDGVGLDGSLLQWIECLVELCGVESHPLSADTSIHGAKHRD